MSAKDNDLILIEAIKWLGDIGCSEPLNSDKRDFYGLISNPEYFEEEKIDSKIPQNFNFENIDNIKSLKKYLLSKIPDLNINAFSYDGFENSDLMVIGDKSDVNINNNEKPFHGEVGKLLDAMLKAIGFDQSNTYYTNIYLLSDSIDKGMINKIIKKQILIVQPKVIIMLGAEVTKILTNIDKSIFQTRGKWFDIEIDNISNSIPGISMFHPRYILANLESKKETWEDLKAVRKKLT
tara:strand:- start:3215 stop:3925 length:711 start_codon:yes stop_codon:yes gene_type:complete